jgi:hypothetical protein
MTVSAKASLYSMSDGDSVAYFGVVFKWR